jgi:putative aldouronate transport system substrate-binding protein
VAGKIAVFISSFGNPWNDVWRQARDLSTPFDILFVPPFPATSGGKPAHFLGVGFQSATALKKASPDRVKELLRILNYLAAPFGSQEDLLLTAGIPGTDYNRDPNGNPVLTDRGNADANQVPWKYVMQRPQVMYLPDIPNYAQTLYDVEQTLIPIGVADPSLGLYSPTASAKGVTANLTWYDNMTDIIAGRRPLSDYDDMLKAWQDAAGNKVRMELMQAYAASQ